MQNTFFQLITLIIIVLGLVMVANRFRVAYPIVLVLGGMVLSFTTLFSHIAINPEIVFFVFLPPLLFEAAWQTSWKEFWRFRRVITSFAFPIVILTSCAVAVVSHTFIPGFTLALGFLLGGIISPPDAISATTIMQQVGAPKPIVTIIEGESLLNDAASLIVFRFALAAVLTGQFHFGEAAGSFFVVIVLGTLIGLLVGAVFYAIYRWLPTTPSIDTVLTLVAPYLMYYVAENFHYSGVLAVVSGGLLLANQRDSLLSYRSRVQGVNVWSVLGFVLNGLVFLLIGLQLPIIVKGLGSVSLGGAIGYGLLISLALMLVRLACAFGAAEFTRVASHFITVAEANPGWQAPLIIGWAGMRGVVSLASALSVPVLLRNGLPFPARNLILFITFVVILVTLVFQGLTLPWLIRKMHLVDPGMPESEQELIIQKKIAQQALQLLDKLDGQQEQQNVYIQNLRARFQLDVSLVQQKPGPDSQLTGKGFEHYRQLYLELLGERRSLLQTINQHAEFDEKVVRKYLTLTDLEEFKLRETLRQISATD